MIYGENLKITFANVPSWGDANEWALHLHRCGLRAVRGRDNFRLR